MNFGFEYFCGANVLVRIGSMPILEASGISFGARESKRPIYGYSSRHFDAMARGQVLVQGNLAINFVHQDYLYHAIRAGLNGNPVTETVIPNIATSEIGDYMSVLGENSLQDAAVIDSLKKQFWAVQQGKAYRAINDTRNPFDNGAGINIRITFGDQDMSFKDSGKTGILLSNVHFSGRSNVINIDEGPIVEIHEFLARDILSLRVNQYTQSVTTESISLEELEQVLTIQ